MSDKFVIKGGKRPRGEIEARGAKNAAFPILAAALLTKEPCVIANLPLIEDVFRMIEIIKELGAEVSWLGKRKIEIKCSDVNPEKIPQNIVRRFRGSTLILGPLLARFGKIKISPPGGCLIGARSLDTHLDVFSQVGVKNSFKNKKYLFEKNPKFKPLSFISGKKICEVVLREFSVTATENILLFSALNPQKTVIKIVDNDYQIQDLIKVLRKMGARIRGKGTHALEVVGKKKLKGFSHYLVSDPIEAGTFICLALALRGEVVIKNARLAFLTLFLKRLKDFGAKFKVLDSKTIKIFPSPNLKIDKIQSLPYPGISTDLQPELGVLATQTKGGTLIHDPLYEGRLKYLEDLNKMGADIVFCDPHRAIVTGPVRLRGIKVSSPDLRAGAALLIAGLIAKGETIIENVYQIDRGYERIEKRLQKLGLDIKRVKE